MPDVREVYEMVTKQKPPEPGALERQQKRQVRSARNKKIGALVVAAAIGVVAIVLILRTHPGLDTTTPANGSTAVNPVGAAEEVATSFLGAYGAFNAEQATTYLADDADLTGFIGSGYSEGPEGLPRFISFLEAEGYEQTITSCEGSPVGPDISVVCAFDFHAIRSDEVGRGPFTGSTFTFTVRDGQIFRASQYWEIAKFSPQMWEPFAHWVSTTYPKDAAVMYQDGTYANYSLTQRSIRLWEQRTREYVKQVRAGSGQ
jgi:hypothetical protein